VEQVKERNKAGDRFFLLVNHSLACQECVDQGEAEMCCHRLFLIPPWKSLLQFASMKRLIPKSKKETFAQEVFGVITSNSARYFQGKLVDASLFRRIDVRDARRIWVGVDPASHGKSEMGITAITVTSTGLHVIVGAASINVNRCEMAQLSGCMRQFVGRLRAQYKGAEIVPIVETNNNEIAATSLLRAMGPVWNPFTRENFDTYISEDIGVLTTKATKMSMVQQTYLALINGQIAVATQGIVADRSAFEERGKPANFCDLIDELGAQLKRFADQPDGTVSGKTISGENDDMAIAFMMCIYWRVCVLAATSNAR
jgi:hypothetical protein